MSAALPFMEPEVRGGACATLLKKRLSIFGDRKRERTDLGGVVTASAGGVRGFEKNIEEKMSGIGGMSAAVPFTMREILGCACAT